MQTFRRTQGLVLFLAAIATACGGGDGGTPPWPDPNAVTSVVVTPNTVTLDALGATSSLAAEARNSAGTAVSGRTFSWTSSNLAVATVDANGAVTAVANGSTTISAAVNGATATGQATVTVQQAIANFSVQPGSRSLAIGATIQLTTTATDSRSNPVTGLNVAWTSATNSVATVSSTGLVTAIAAGTAQISAAAGGASASVTITVLAPALTLTADTSLAGTLNYTSVEIPAGVTVTATGPLTLRSSGLVSIAGTLTGDCVPVDVQSDTALVITGSVTNGCAAGTDADLRLAATGELTLEGALVTSSGDITLTNDPTLTEASFPFLVAMRRPLAALMPGGIPFTRLANSTVRYAGGATGPNPAAAGMDGLNGTDGANGRNVKMFLNGNAIFAGNTMLWGQDGGRGGNGSQTLNTPVSDSGGNGGKGGDTKVLISGTLTYQGGSNTVRAGRGGAGGSAFAKTTTNAAFGAKAPGATAKGGRGGEPGLVDIRAGGGIVITSMGDLIVELGSGAGGDATAIAADGVDALTRPNEPAQEGGDASATAGRGGHTPDARVIQQGVTGAPVFAEVDGGVGGSASSTAGNGGHGVKPLKDGAKGGAITATGGAGGDGRLRDATNAPLGVGGAGGDAIFVAGNGGRGWNDCAVGMLEAGGNGGAGGSATGRFGARGARATMGDGVVRYNNVGNGGKGGDGSGPGQAGAAGTDAQVNPKGTPVVTGSAFQPGAPGLDCTPPPPEPTVVDIRPKLPVSIGLVNAGTYSFDLRMNSVVVGSIPVSTFGPQGTHFVGQNPLRVGWAANSGWETDVSQVMVNGQPFDFTHYSVCIINAFISPSNPMLVEQLDQNGQVIETTQITTLAAQVTGSVGARQLLPGGRRIKKKAGTRKFRTRGPGGDRSCEELDNGPD